MVDDRPGAEALPKRGQMPSKKQIGKVLAGARAGDIGPLNEYVLSLHPADIADFLEQIRAADRHAVFALISEDMKGRVLSELEKRVRGHVLARLEPGTLHDITKVLDSDDFVDIIEDVTPAKRDAVLDALEAEKRRHAEAVLQFPEDSAGRLMQREVVALPDDWTVGEAIDELRRRRDLPDEFFHIVLIDPDRRPVGLVSLGAVMGAHRKIRLSQIAEPELHSFRVDLPQEEVAYAFNQYHAISVPVVDGAGRLAGVITVDDAMAVLDEEHDEDMLRLGGVHGESQLTDGVLETARRRLPWLGVATANSLVVALTIAIFERAIDQIVALAILMPMVAAIGGAAGTQALTVAVRGLATRDLTAANRSWVIGRESLTGLICGVVLAIVIAAIAELWFGVAGLWAVVGLAMVITIATAGLTGVCVPLLLDKLGFDPALASGTFVTTAIDVLGFFTFLGLATIVLL